VSLRRDLNRLRQALAPDAPVAAVCREDGTLRSVLWRDGRSEPPPDGMTAADLPPACEVFVDADGLTHLPCVTPGGEVSLLVIGGIDLDTALGIKKGPPFAGEQAP
jgi:hypothetical protein